MKKILFILIISLGFLQTNAQESSNYKFVLNGIIGMSNIVPIQDAVIEVNDEVKFTNESGEFEIKIKTEEIRVQIQHLGFSKIDTILNTKKLKRKTELIIVAHCSVNTELAKSDISKKELKLLLVGGIAPTFVIGQELIEKKYGFNYDDFGCSPQPDECIKEYNYEIFKHLDDMYGDSWRVKVRNDVIGLNDYIKGQN